MKLSVSTSDVIKHPALRGTTLKIQHELRVRGEGSTILIVAQRNGGWKVTSGRSTLSALITENLAVKFVVQTCGVL